MKKNKQTSLSLFLALLFIGSSYSSTIYSSKKSIKKNQLFTKRKRKRKKEKNKKQKLSPNNSSKNFNNSSNNVDSSDRNEICKLFNLSTKTENKLLFTKIIKYLDPYNKNKLEKIKLKKYLSVRSILYLTKKTENTADFYKKILPILKNKTNFSPKQQLLLKLKLPLTTKKSDLLLELQKHFGKKYNYLHLYTKKPSLNNKTPRKYIYKNILQRLQNEESKEDSSESCQYEDSSEEDDGPIWVTL